jgi:hypothetical protein
MRTSIVAVLAWCFLIQPLGAAEEAEGVGGWSDRVQTVLDVTEPLRLGRADLLAAL